MHFLRALAFIIVAIRKVLLPLLRANSLQNVLFKGAKQFKAGRLRQRQGKARRACRTQGSRKKKFLREEEILAF